MNLHSVTRNYNFLTAEERFRLILAAGGRKDTVEQGRLANASRYIAVTMKHHAPYQHAFSELSMTVYTDIHDQAVCYLEAMRMDSEPDEFDDDVDLAEIDSAADDGAHAIVPEPGTAVAADDVTPKQHEPDDDADETPEHEFPQFDQNMRLMLAAGYILRTKINGWKLFCERWNIPPFILWEIQPGFHRVNGALKIAESASFRPKGMLRWINAARQRGTPRFTSVPLTEDKVADETDELFRDLVHWWGGPKS